MREEEKLPKELANYHMGFNAAHSKVDRRFLPLCNRGFSDYSWYSTLQCRHVELRTHTGTENIKIS